MGAYPYSSIPMPVPSGMGFRRGGQMNIDKPYGSVPLASFQTGGDVHDPGDPGFGDPGSGDPGAPYNPYGGPVGILDPSRYSIIAPTKYHGWLIFDKMTGGTRTPSADELAQIEGGVGGGTAGAAANYHLDPRELQLEYDKLYQDALKTGVTEEDARRQALASLINNRNTESVALSNAYGNIADKAAAFAQKPEDAVADLMYRQAMYGKGQGGTPYGSIGNPQFGQLQGALSDKFQQMFGPAADALKTAQGFLSSPPPSEFLSDQRSNLGLPAPSTAGAGAPANPVPGGAQGGSITGSFFGVPLASGWGFAQGGSASVQPAGIAANIGAPNTSAGVQGAADGALVSFEPVSMALGGSLGYGTRLGDLIQAAQGTGRYKGASAGDRTRQMIYGIQHYNQRQNPLGTPVSGPPPTMGAPVTPTAFKPPNLGTPTQYLPTTMGSTIAPTGQFGSTGGSPMVSFSRGGVIGNGSGSVGADIGFSNFGTVSSSGDGGYAQGGRIGVHPPPMPAEGGLSLNLSEPAKIVGVHSGHVYATVAEPRPDGTPRPERLEIKPLKSELAKDKELQAQHKQTAMTPQQTLATGDTGGGGMMPAAPGNPQGQMAGGQMTGMNSYAQGGGITFGQSPSDFYGQLRSSLSQLGVQTPTGQALPDPRMLSGDVYTQTQRDPYLTKYITSGYNALGVPDIQDTINRFSPEKPQQSFFRPLVDFG